MTRVVFIGAGSVVFTKQLLADLYGFDDLELEIVLHDIAEERLAVAHQTALQLATRFGRAPNVWATTDRRAALAGADFVINAILVGGAAPGRIDLEVPAEAGLLQTVADTTGVGGVFRALRTIPVLSGIAADLAVVAPHAILLNYTNPMSMNVWWLSRVAPWLQTYGLCHSVYWTVRDLCELVGVPFEGTTFRASGVNHQAWLTEWSRDGVDLYPRLRERIAADADLSRRVRVEIFKRVGFYPTETSKHSAEYLSWFMRSQQQIERFGIQPLDHIHTDERNMQEYAETRDALSEGRQIPLDDDGSTEYAPQVIHSMVTGTRRDIHVNVPNHDLIDNLPEGAVVEVPAVVSRDGISPTAVGAIPTTGAALTRTYLSVGELTIEAALTGDRELVRRAVLIDGNASSSLTPDEIWSLCDRLTELHRRYLPASLGGDVDLPDVPHPE